MGVTSWVSGLVISLVLALLSPLRAANAQPQDGFNAVRYHLEVTYDPTAQSLHGQATVQGIWRAADPLQTLFFFLPPNTLSRRDPREAAAYSDLRYAQGFSVASLVVHQVTDSARIPLAFQLADDPAVPVGHVPDRALLRITLPKPSHSGRHFRVTISFTTWLPRAKNWGHYAGVMAVDGGWYPTLVPYHNGKWIWGLHEFIHAHYELKLTTRVEQHIVASVPWTTHTHSQGHQLLYGRAGPLYHLGLSSRRPRYRECDDTSLPVLCLIAHPQDEVLAAHLLRTLRDILDFYQQQFRLELPSQRFTVVVHERDLSQPFSASADNVLFFSRDLIRTPALMRKLAEFYLARSTAQQWWGLRTAYNLNTSRWIGEGLTTYVALRWLDDQYGKGRNFLTWKSAWLPNFSYREQLLSMPYRRLMVQRHDPALTTPIDQATDREGLRLSQDRKGALIYSMLHDVLGAATFQAFLHRLTTVSHQTVISTREVQQAAEVVSGRDLESFFQQWVWQSSHLDYAVGKVEIIRQPKTDGELDTYVNQVEIVRLGSAIMPVTVRLQASDGTVSYAQLAGTARSEVLTWNHHAQLSDVQIDPHRQLPDVHPLNNRSAIAYTVRPLIDFPHLDSYLVYPFVTLENNFIDGNYPRLSLVGRYLDDQAAILSVGYKETPAQVGIEGQFWRQRFPHPAMTSFVTFHDRLGAKTLSLHTSLLREESQQQYRLPANVITLGYQIAFLDRQLTFRGDPVAAADFPSTGRLHSLFFHYTRDVRIPPAFGAPLSVLSEPLSYGYAFRVEAEIASEKLGSTRPDFQQVRGEVSQFLRLWNQTWLHLRLFGGWSAGTIPFQRKLTLSGVQAIRGYPYELRFLGDRMIGGTLGVRLPLVRDIRLDAPGRYVSLRSIHLGPFVDGGWIWNATELIHDTKMRSGVGVRVIAGMGFGSLLRFEIALDIAHAIDAQGRAEGEGVQIWLRFQNTANGGIHY